MRGLMLPAIAGLALALAACDSPGGTPYAKSGADAEQTRRDVADCRGRVNAYLAKDHGIDEDRSATIPGSGRPSGPTNIRRDMDSGSDGRRSGRLMNDCMQAKGYSGGTREMPGLRW
jgi:hypothetical protein